MSVLDTLEDQPPSSLNAIAPHKEFLRDLQPPPLLSVLCLTYNHEKYISTAIDSFLSQVTSFAIEIIIGEDCSTDTTLSIVENYKNRFPQKIQIIKSEFNVGMVKNLRRTMKACRGKYIAICEGDDFWEGTSKLQQQVDFLENNSDYSITYHDAYVFDESGIRSKVQLGGSYQCDATSNELIAARPISTLTACFRNILGEFPREFDHAPVPDLCIWSLLGHHGKGKYIKSIEPAAYRIHSGGVFSSQNEKTRYLQTMQTYLVLSDFYSSSRHGQIATIFLYKTALMAILRLGISSRLKVLGVSLDALAGHPLHSLKRYFTKI